MSNQPICPISTSRIAGEECTSYGIVAPDVVVLSCHDEGDWVLLVRKGERRWIYELPPPRRRPWWKRWFSRA